MYSKRVCSPHLFAMLGNFPFRTLSSFNCDLSGNDGMKLELGGYKSNDENLDVDRSQCAFKCTIVSCGQFLSFSVQALSIPSYLSFKDMPCTLKCSNSCHEGSNFVNQQYTAYLILDYFLMLLFTPVEKGYYSSG